MTRSSNFTDGQRAAIFVRDRATCVYSGDNLWILEGGAWSNFTVDWADHVIPATKGGLSTLENGVCAGWDHNKKKRDSIKEAPVLFKDGKPEQPRFNELRKTLRPAILDDLVRFSNLRPSDWYFNRAMYRLLLGVGYMKSRKGIRDDTYYAKATLNAIEKWDRIKSQEQVAPMEERKLAPTTPSRDQELMLSVREAKSVDAILATMKELLPLYAGEK